MDKLSRGFAANLLICFPIVILLILTFCARANALPQSEKLGVQETMNIDLANQTISAFNGTALTFEMKKDTLAREYFDYFAAGNFYQLEKLANSYKATKATFINGLPKINHMFWRTAEQASTLPKEKVESLFQKWDSQYPKSLTAALMKAIYYQELSWEYRSGKYIHEIPSDSLAKFEEYQLKSAGILHTLLSQEIDDPEVYNASLNLVASSVISFEEMQALFDEGIKHDSNYISLYSSMATYLMPRWIGFQGPLKKFIERASSNGLTDKNEQDIRYAYLSNFLLRSSHTPEQFKSYQLSWPRIRMTCPP